jgi:hypothetical protein
VREDKKKAKNHQLAARMKMSSKLWKRKRERSNLTKWRPFTLKNHSSNRLSLRKKEKLKKHKMHLFNSKNQLTRRLKRYPRRWPQMMTILTLTSVELRNKSKLNLLRKKRNQ